jgi:hypothetical protein
VSRYVHYECDEGYELFGVADSYSFGGVWVTPTPVCHGRYIMSVMKGTSCLE